MVSIQEARMFEHRIILSSGFNYVKLTAEYRRLSGATVYISFPATPPGVSIGVFNIVCTAVLTALTKSPLFVVSLPYYARGRERGLAYVSY